jgi:hypothetical protein
MLKGRRRLPCWWWTHDGRMVEQIDCQWRDPVTDDEMVVLVNSYGGSSEVGWWDRIRPHSLGWVVGRAGDGSLAAFVNVA